MINKKKNSPVKNADGAAMVLVLCVMVLFMTLALTIIFSSATFMHSARQGAIEKQCQALAISFEERVQEQMTKKESDMMPGATGELQTGIQQFIRRRIDEKTFPAESHWLPSTEGDSPILHQDTYAISLGDSLGEAGYALRLRMYWTAGEGDPENKDYDGIRLVTTVVCKNNDKVFQIKTAYYLEESETGGGGKSIWTWKLEGEG